MIRRKLGLIAWLSVMALLLGCLSAQEPTFNPTLLPRVAVAPENQMPGRVALCVPSIVQATVFDFQRQIRLHTGRIVEQAVLVTLGDGLQGGVQQVNVPSPAGGGYNATLVINSVRFEQHKRLLWFIPLSLLNGVWKDEYSTRLAFDLSLFDAQGHSVWTHTYEDDAGRLAWTTPGTDIESFADGLVRVAHEAAWRLSQQTLHELREWMETERLKQREL